MNIKERINQLRNSITLNLIIELVGIIALVGIIIFASVATYLADTSYFWMFMKIIIILLVLGLCVTFAKKITKYPYHDKKNKQTLIVIVCMLLPSALFMYDLQFRGVPQSHDGFVWRLDTSTNKWVSPESRFFYKAEVFEEVHWRTREKKHKVAVVIEKGDFSVHIQASTHVSKETWELPEVAFSPDNLKEFLKKNVHKTITGNWELCRMENLQGFSKNFYYEGSRLVRADLH